MPGTDRDLRTRVARGTLINAAFQVGLAGLNLVKRVSVAAFLTREQFGVWGIILGTLITLAWLKQVGVLDRYIQQSEPDQELAFQRAFTMELAVSCAYFVLVCIVIGPIAAAYGHPEIIAPGVVLATAVIITAFQTPSWIPLRRMQFARQRLLTSVDPVVSVIGMVALGAAGYGYWGLVVGSLLGSVAGAVVCTFLSTYPLRIRWDWQTLRAYASFSWPLFGLSMSGLLVVQGSLLVANYAVGLAGVGAIGLATSIAAFSNRVDAIVSQTIYPAVCRVADRSTRLAEIFVKSNRLALMWAMPFAIGLALFADDLVQYVLGAKWHSAVPLLIAAGLTAGVGQLAFNWSVFMRALDKTRGLFIASLLDLAVFACIMVPALLAWGLPGYATGLAASTMAQIMIRTVYMRSLLGAFDPVRQILRAAAPTLPPAGAILIERLALDGGRSPGRALAEVMLYSALVVMLTLRFERRLVAELLGYVRGRVASSESVAASGA